MTTSIANLVAVLAVATVSLVAAPALADDPVGGYDAKYEEVANNCTNVGMQLTSGVVTVTKQGAGITVDLDKLPVMTGTVARTGKFKAQSKLGATTINGLDGKFSVGGSVTGGKLSMVFIAEYFVKDKALCSQSWNVTGTKK